MEKSPNTAEILRTEDLSKRYGRITAVDSLNIRLLRGEVFGFLGPNGSGKSTTVGMMLGLIQPTNGRVVAFGDDMMLHPWPALKRIGSVVEAPAFYPYLSGYDNLKAIRLMLGDIPVKRIDEMLELVGLGARARDPYKSYSLGMKQRLGIASTLLRDPELIILDEPTNGLDPAGTREVRELIPRLAREGRTVFLCSHLLHEVQEVSDRVGIVRRGQLVAEGAVDELLGRGQYLRLRSEDNSALADAMTSIPWVSRLDILDGFVRATVPPDRSAELNRVLAEQGIYLSELAPWEADLESVFLQLTGEASDR